MPAIKLMPAMRQIRFWIAAAVAILVLLDLLGLGLLLSPAGRSLAARMAEHDRLRASVIALKESNQKELFGEARLMQTRQQVTEFYGQRFPAHYSNLSSTLHKLASESHVNLVRVKYDGAKSDEKLTPEQAKLRAMAGVQTLSLQLQAEGSYRSLVQFVNALERSQMLFVLRGVTIGGDTKGLTFDLRVETYLKDQAL